MPDNRAVPCLTVSTGHGGGWYTEYTWLCPCLNMSGTIVRVYLHIIVGQITAPGRRLCISRLDISNSRYFLLAQDTGCLLFAVRYGNTVPDNLNFSGSALEVQIHLLRI